MSTRILQRKIPSHRRSVDPANPLYGFDYRPDWPSILSIAHDEADGENSLSSPTGPASLGELLRWRGFNSRWGG